MLLVEVYEKKADVGLQHQGQIHLIENVFSYVDTLANELPVVSDQFPFVSPTKRLK